MKKIVIISTIGLMLLICSFGQPNDNKLVLNNEQDSSQIKLDKREKVRLEKRRLIEDEDRIDSIRLSTVLDKALIIASRNIDLKTFTIEFESEIDSIFKVITIMKMDTFFSDKYKYLIIHRSSPSLINIDVYIKRDNKFEKVITHEESNLTYVNDTIQDVNGDGQKDFLVNWYGNNGCCLKNFYNVYLLHADNGIFSQSYEFINPTFSAKEKLIRGVRYGQPGETELYKFRWNGLKVDTVEYIYPDILRKGHYLKSDRLPYASKSVKETKIKDVPIEYKNIYGYGWFLGKGL
jgi:hypothetical protein